jgi:hypothetical protein
VEVASNDRREQHQRARASTLPTRGEPDFLEWHVQFRPASWRSIRLLLWWVSREGIHPDNTLPRVTRPPGTDPMTMQTSHRHITTDHDEIRRWVEAHHGAPARMANTATAGVLRIDVPGHGTSGLEPISWHEWFTAFDGQRLALCYPDPHIHGGTSAWFELVHRDIGDGVFS